MSIEPKEIEPTGWVNKLGPFFVILFLGLALGGFIISFLLPSIWKPDSLAAVELIKADYQSMLMEGIKDLPKETTAYAEREECWTGDQTHCVYGWYTEWKGAVYLISYTYGTREDDRRGILRGWWWEVDMKNKTARPVWLSEALWKSYALQPTEGFLGLIDLAEKQLHPAIPPLMKIP
ncbi:MAG: hypothetical protein LLH30_16940 [Candidatus Manganitrophus sp. SA1]|nr:hypothetical protein [Candidatus Manganitrophus morganii]